MRMFAKTDLRRVLPRECFLSGIRGDGGPGRKPTVGEGRNKSPLRTAVRRTAAKQAHQTEPVHAREKKKSISAAQTLRFPSAAAQTQGRHMERVRAAMSRFPAADRSPGLASSAPAVFPQLPRRFAAVTGSTWLPWQDCQLHGYWVSTPIAGVSLGTGGLLPTGTCRTASGCEISIPCFSPGCKGNRAKRKASAEKRMNRYWMDGGCPAGPRNGFIQGRRRKKSSACFFAGAAENAILIQPGRTLPGTTRK